MKGALMVAAIAVLMFFLLLTVVLLPLVQAINAALVQVTP
jgi:hypothetical protein